MRGFKPFQFVVSALKSVIPKRGVRISDPVAALMADGRLEEPARVSVKDIVERAYHYKDELNDLATAVMDGPAASAFLSAMSLNAQSAVTDAAERNELVVQHRVFKDIWTVLADASDEYLSVCDLSPFHDLHGRELNEEARRWELRLNREIAHLKTLVAAGGLRKFDKIIVYSPRGSGGREWNGAAPACVTGNGCAGPSCKTACMVQSVTKKWVESGLETMVASHSSQPTQDGQARITWTAHREDIDDALWDVNAQIEDESKKITSADIGLFGATIVGEEFKFIGERFQIRRGPLSDVLPQTPSIDDPDPTAKRPFGYVYKFRRAHELNQDLRRSITDQMEPEKYIRRAAV